MTSDRVKDASLTAIAVGFYGDMAAMAGMTIFGFLAFAFRESGLIWTLWGLSALSFVGCTLSIIVGVFLEGIADEVATMEARKRWESERRCGRE